MKHSLLVSVFMSMILLVLSACGTSAHLGPGGDSSADSSASYIYSLSYNKCDTGSHSFDGLDALWAGLQNEELNHGCAVSMRADFFKSHSCPGTFLPK